MGMSTSRLDTVAQTLIVGMVAFLLAVAPAYGAPTVRRTAGGDRYETSKNVVLDAFTKSNWAVVCTGEFFADALAATGLAGTLGSIRV